MRVVIVHLSDLHLVSDTASNVVLSRVEEICKAAASASYDADLALLVISGDVAQSGRPPEYEQALQFCRAVEQSLPKYCRWKAPRWVCVPGNHDCDFTDAAQARESLLQVAESALADGSVIEQCTQVQVAFRAFEEQVTNMAGPQRGVDILSRQIDIPIDGTSISLLLLNSAWCSRNPEQPGTLRVPTGMVRDRLTKTGVPSLVVAVMHHTQNWLQPENARAVRQLFDECVDVVLTGHEHDSYSFRSSGPEGEQNDYFEGSVLQESDDATHSEFQVIVLDLEAHEEICHLFTWDTRSSRYSSNRDPIKRPFAQNRKRVRERFPIADKFAQYLGNTGASFTHGGKLQVGLSDIYVYPELEPVDLHATGAQTILVRNHEVLSYVVAEPQLMILGGLQAGKTSLAKMLFRDLHRQGKAPLLLYDKHILRLTDRNVNECLESALKEQYDKKTPTDYWQMQLRERVVILDDYHKLVLKRAAKEALVRELSSRFGQVILIASGGLVVSELLDPDMASSVLWSFRLTQLREFGHVQRSKLIRRWYALDDSEPEDELHQRCVRTESIVSSILGRDMIPAYPIYVLMVLQHLEIGAGHGDMEGDFGYLHESLTLNRLNRKRLKEFGLDRKFTYLSRLAWHLHLNGCRTIARTDFDAWHQAHCGLYNMQFAVDVVLDHMIELEVLVSSDGEVSFSDSYLYTFCIARYMRDNLGTPAVQAALVELAGRLYHEESSRILLFLCHLAKDKTIVDTVLAAANSLFAKMPLANLAEDIKPFQTLLAKELKFEIGDDKPEDNRQAALGVRDRGDDARRIHEREQSAKTLDLTKDRIDEAAYVNSAFKTIQILGEVLRNFAGSMEGDRQNEMLEAIYNLSLRTLSYIFETVASRNERIVEAFGQIIRKHTHTDLTPRELQDVAQFALGTFIHMAVSGLIRHVTDTAGSRDLTLAMDQAIRGKTNRALLLLDLSMRLDHGSDFPKPKVKQLVKELHNNEFCMSILRQLVWRYFYMFPSKHELREEMCTRLGITRSRKLLNRDVKKLGPMRR